jgi:mannan endo-1,4-beta-mannosidase
VLNHKNFYTGVKLKDDPTIMTWELANEPRCDGGDFPRSASCTSTTLTTWANEMSSYIKHIDPKHLVSMGDEGFYCDPSAADPFDHCADGVDTLAFTSLPNIDVMSFHLYPDSWNQTVAWGQQWIERHFADAMAHGKPAMLGEFGLLDTTLRNPNYKLWTDTAFEVGGAGALYWMLAGIQDDGSLYPDFDGYTVYCPSPVCEAYSHFSHEMTAERVLPFAPVADDDIAETVGVKAVTLNLLANDVTYDDTTLIQSSVDLDPTTAGQQITLQTATGLFVAASDGTVSFVATAGFTGNATATYTVSDSRGRLSDPATISVTVKPDPRAPQLLFSFEDGTESWAAASFNAAGTVAQSADFASLGSFSLKITPNAGGGWFGVEYATPIDLSTRSHVLWEVKTANSPTSQELALQTGDTFAFCTAGGFQFIQANTTATIDVDLAQLDCGGTAVDLKKVHSFLIFAGNGGPDPLYIDNVRATPLPPAAPPLYGFEDGTDNWLPASFNASAGSTEQSTDFATEGSFGLKITPTGGGWFGVEYQTPISLAGKTHVLWDIKTTTSGTSLELALQTGTNFDFCTAGGFQFLNPNTTSTIDIDLAQLDCGGGTVDLSQIHNFYIFLGSSGSGVIYLDNIRATAAAPPLYGFETGTDNWAPASFNAGAGTVAQSTDFATEGSFSLKVTPTGGGWFGVEYASPISLAGKTHVTWDLKTTASGTPQELALQTGTNFDFCSAGGFQFIAPNTTTSIDIDLTTLDCGGATPDLTQIHNFYIFMGNSGPDPIYIDNVQAK